MYFRKATNKNFIYLANTRLCQLVVIEWALYILSSVLQKVPKTDTTEDVLSPQNGMNN